jgi:hypothetical protein
MQARQLKKTAMNWTALILVVCCVWRPAAAAETAQDRGKRVVYEALQALGGDAFLRMEDRIESGRAYSFDNGKLSGTSVAKIYTRYLVRPEPPVPGQIYLRERQGFGKDEFQTFLFREDGAWEITFRGAQPLPDERVTNFKDSIRRNIFYILRNRLKEPGMAFYSQGSDRWENRPVEKVEITDADNVMVTVFFDQTSKLPVRQVFRRRNNEFKDFDTEVSLFAKYRDVGGGVQWPYDIRRDRNGDKIFEMYSDSVEINKDLKDDMFSLAANVKMLPKAK